MRFEKHVFISYGHVDNITTSDEELAWVSRFHNDLRAYLSTNLGRDAEIWRDDRLRGNTIFEGEIAKQFPGTATLVSVLTRRYLDSDWCKKELDAFCAAASHNGGLIVDDKARVLKVMLKPIPSTVRGGLPAVLRDAIGYEFYHEVEGNRFLPLDPKFGNAEAYNRKVYFLAEDVASLVQQLEESSSQNQRFNAGQQPASGPTVYLAECSYDRAEDRQHLRDELRANGYTVLPEQGVQLPELEADYAAEVTRLLRQCDVSIHLIGSFHGNLPDGPSGKAAVRLQNDIAAKLTTERRLYRIISLPSRTASDEPNPTNSFVDMLTRDSGSQRGADVIVGDFEELKSAVRASLEKAAKPAQPAEAPQPVPRSVYLVCVEQDLPALEPLAELLVSQGLSVELPVFSGEAAEVRKANEAFAMRCDGVMIFCGVGDGAWLFHQQNELRRIAGLRRGAPWRAQYLYLAGPPTSDKRALLLKKPSPLINAMEGFAPEQLRPLLDQLRDV